MTAKMIDPRMKDEHYREIVQKSEDNAYKAAFIQGVNEIAASLQQFNALLAQDIARNKQQNNQ